MLIIETDVGSIAAANGPLTPRRPSIEYSNGRQTVDNFLLVVGGVRRPCHRRGGAIIRAAGGSDGSSAKKRSISGRIFLTRPILTSKTY